MKHPEHYSVAYYGEMFEWWSYNAELKDYIGTEKFENATGLKKKNLQPPPEDGDVTRDTILDFIKANRK